MDSNFHKNAYSDVLKVLDTGKDDVTALASALRLMVYYHRECDENGCIKAIKGLVIEHNDGVLEDASRIDIEDLLLLSERVLCRIDSVELKENRK